MTLADMRARLRRGFARIWARIKAVFKRAPGWPAPPVDDTHRIYRDQYEALIPVLPNLPRGGEGEYERRRTLLFLAEILDGLHNYGDDPIMPPGVRRVVVRETQRLASIGAVGKPAGLLGAVSGNVQLWIGAALLAFGATGWVTASVQGARLEASQARLEAKSEDYAMIARQNEALRATNADLSQMVTAADTQTRQTAESIETERARRLRAEAELRRVRNAYEQARAGGATDYGFGSVRDAGPAD